MLFSIHDVDNFFTIFFEELRNSFSWTTFVYLLVGIIIGFVICATIYGVLMLISLKDTKALRKDKNLNINIDNDEIIKKVEDIKARFISSTDGLSVKERFDILGHTIYEAINEVASFYYPNSKYPLYELSIEELIMFLGYLSKRIDDMFNKPFLKPFKHMTISQILKFIDVKRKINENKVVKTINNKHTSKVKNALFMVLNYANPVYWFKKLIMGGTINIATRKICLVIIDIVCDETNKTYSKQIFNEENKLYQEEITKELNDLGDEI